MRWVWVMLLTLSCKTAEPVPDPVAPPPPPPKAKENAVRSRLTPFDVSACAKAPRLAAVTKETLSAWVDFERPRFEACLTPSSAREKDDASAQLDVSVSAKEPLSVKVTGQNVSPEGVACLEGAAKDLGLTATTSLTAQLSVVAPPGAPAANVQLLPEANALRAAVTSACACFEGLSVNAPPQLVLKLGPGSALDVVTAADPLAEKVERCLETTLASHPRPLVELTLDLPLLNGDAAAPSPDASQEVLAQQESVMKRRHSALVVLLDAQRTAVLKQLEPVSVAYKRKPTPKLVKERQAACDALIELEDALPLAVERAKNPAFVKTISLEPSQLCAFARASDE